MQDSLLEELTRELRELRLETKLREAAILSRIERIQQQQSQATVSPVEVYSTSTTTTNPTQINGIQRGDRVLIINKVKKPASWPKQKVWKEDEFRSATVLKVSRDQISILTDNGISTWRAPNNLQLVRHE
jgi:hypothetical protein